MLVKKGLIWESDLASDNSNRRESFPEGHALATMIAEDGASSLDFVYQPNQALHRRHVFFNTKRRIFLDQTRQCRIEKRDLRNTNQKTGNRSLMLREKKKTNNKQKNG